MKTKVLPEPPPLCLQDVAPSDPWRTLEKGMRILSPRVGILRDLGAGVHFSGDPNVFVVGTRQADPSLYADVLAHESHSGAAGLSLAQALAGAIGETVERYCMRFYDYDDFVLGSYEELESRYRMVEPRQVRLHTEEQISAGGRAGMQHSGVQRQLMDEQAQVYWRWGYSLTHEEWKLVPAHLVYLPYRAAEGEARVGIANSSGLAAGATIEEAMLSGLCELIERDAFTISWHNQFIAQRIVIDDPELEALLRVDFNSDHPQVDLRFFDLTMDHGLPTVLAWMRRPTENGGGLYVSAASRPSPRAAVLKAAIEMGQCLPSCRFALEQLAQWQPRDDFSDVTSFERHCALYLKRPDLAPRALALFDQVDSTVRLGAMEDHSTGSILGDLRRIIDLLAAVGHETIVCDITTEDMADLGLRVVRMLAPGMVNLHGNHNWPFLASERLSRIPEKLGWQHLGWSRDAPPSPFPHPFP